MKMKGKTIFAVFLLGFTAPAVFAKKWKNGVADPSCYQDDITWANKTIIDVQFDVTEPQKCQILCKESENCVAFTWTSETNQEIQDGCLLFSSVENEIEFPNSVSGQRSCVFCSENFACRASDENEISVYENVNLEETCQEYCFNTSGCEIYTWYDSNEVLANLCVLLTNCDETFPGCTGCYSGPPTCDNPQPDELAILVTGGVDTETLAEVLFTNGSSICELPPMSQLKRYHTQSGLTACGGYGSDDRSCIKFEDGSWTTLTDNLVEERYYQSSWVNPDGDILLIGGGGSPTTTEIVYRDGTSIKSFDLKYDIRNACSIGLPEMFILTGGESTGVTVSRYTTNGWMEDLPELNEWRDSHGCGYFYNDDMQRVFLVAGGYINYHDVRSSTETLVEGDQAWNFQNPLPTGRVGVRAISLPDTVILTGGRDSPDLILNDVLAYVPETNDWKKIGSMNTGILWHGVSLVNMSDVIDYCQ